MSSRDPSGEEDHGAAVWHGRNPHSWGLRTKAIDALQGNQSFSDYAAERLSSFLCAQLATALIGYLVLVAGYTWLGHGSRGTAALVGAGTAMPMAAALVFTCTKRSGLCSSLAALAFIAMLEVGIVLHAMQSDAEFAAVLPAFVLIPLTFSPVLLRGWDFPAAAVLAAAGPLALVLLGVSSAAQRFGVALSMVIAISTSLVTNLFALRTQKKNFRLERQLRSFADIDDLTQLPRRRRVFELGRRILHRAERLGQPLSVLYIDADHFKSVNDRFGHDAGDRALQIIAREIQEGLRPSDVSGRFGGEEFVALLPGSNQLDAARVAERLRKRIEEMRQFEVPLTISIGIAQHVRGEEIERVIHRADAALLDAKGSGRNRVVIAPHALEQDEALAIDPAAPNAANGHQRVVHRPPGRSTEPPPLAPVADA
jgi:diguanylate cyclase (GGDEF)-like protein